MLACLNTHTGKSDKAMARVSNLPLAQVRPDLRKIMHQYDEELGGSEFVQVFAHAPDLYKRFVEFYFGLVLNSRGAVTMKITELARLKVAEKNDCFL